MAEVKMVSIRDLDGYTFIIPSYQRGFRWTTQQVKELIDDLYTFIRESGKQIYCLQNITVQPTGNENEYYVIDGQQRLTAMWLLTMVAIGWSDDVWETYPIYTLKYEKKDDFSNSVTNVHNAITERLDLQRSAADSTSIARISPLNIKGYISSEDIDSKYLSAAAQYINDYKSIKGVSGVRAIFDIFGSKLLETDPEKQICFIWNELDPAPTDGDSKEDATSLAIDKFSNINANKIPLTESELIKACLINGAKDKSNELSLQWESIERKLSDDSFWAFISGEEEETRMDFLFRVWFAAAAKTGSEKTIDSHLLSRKVEEALNKEGIEGIWNEIVKIYDVLCDWYEDYFYYHTIGLLVETSSDKPAVTIKNLYQEYAKSTKKDFKDYLKQEVRKNSIYKDLFSIDAGKKWISDARQIDLENENLTYGGKFHKKIKPILLLFNIALLLNAYEVNPKNTAERFSFEFYKNRENPLEIEHINPQHLTGKTGGDADARKKWAQETLAIIPDSDDKDKLWEEIEKADWTKPKNSLVEKIENAARLHALSNLTLVDKQLNISYGDNFFLKKRQYILAARFGLKDENERIKEHSIILPGTMWVFMRQYVDTTSTDEKTNGSRWTDDDRQQYIKAMQESIFKLLTIEEEQEGE